jgi:hypothetical protein
VHSYTISSLKNEQKNKTMCIQDEGGQFEQLLQNKLHKVQAYSFKQLSYFNFKYWQLHSH